MSQENPDVQQEQEQAAPEQPAVLDLDRLADLGRLQALAAHPLADAELRRELAAVCRRAAEGVRGGVVTVDVVLDAATLGLAAFDGKESGPAGSVSAPAEWMPSAWVAAGGEELVVYDVAGDVRFARSPVLVSAGVRSYAGVPLVDADGHVLGAVSALHGEPVAKDEPYLEALRTAAREAAEVLASRRQAAGTVEVTPAGAEVATD